MLGIASLVRTFGSLIAPEVVACLPASLFLRLAFWMSVVVSFLGFLCGFGGGVVLARLMASNWDSDMTVWFRAAMYSSCDVDSWRGFPPCLGETSSSYMSMSRS